MTETSVFETDQHQTAEPQVETTAFSSLVGDGKKFSDNEALAKSKIEADAYIEQLKQENAEMRKEVNSKAATEEILKELEKRNQPPSTPADNGLGVSSPEELADIVRKEIDQTSIENTAKANVLEADRFITEKLGGKDKAKTFLTEKSQELGMPVSWLMEVAAKNPSALYNVIGLDTTQREQTPNKASSLISNVNTEQPNFGDGAPKEGTKAFFDGIRKQSKSKYFTAEVQNAIFKSKKEGTYD